MAALRIGHLNLKRLKDRFCEPPDQHDAHRRRIRRNLIVYSLQTLIF